MSEEAEYDRDNDPWRNEPHIIINGKKLNLAETMTLRVAMGSFAMSLQDGLGDDAHGKTMTGNYLYHINSIHKHMFDLKPVHTEKVGG